MPVQIELNLVAQAPPRSDAEAVTDQKHPDNQLGVDRGRPMSDPRRGDEEERQHRLVGFHVVMRSRCAARVDRQMPSLRRIVK